MHNPFEAPTVNVADPEIDVVRRPRVVTIAIVILAFPLVVWTVLGTAHLVGLASGKNTWAPGYVSYVIFLMVVPLFLIAMIGRRRNWARIALAMIYGLDLIWRIAELATVVPVTAASLSPVVMPNVFRILAFVLLWLPRSNAWFAAERVARSQSIIAP